MLERKRYDADFKRRIVEMVVEKGRTCAEVGLEYGITPKIISRWTIEYRNGAGWARSVEKLAEDTEHAATKRRVRDLEMQLEFVKKTAIYFATLGKK
ncbi:MAG: transposase [Proteobacteria bacterium]|nr:transposase [Pseudomonadota bacterium]